MRLTPYLDQLLTFDPANPLLFTAGLFLPVALVFFLVYQSLGKTPRARLAWVFAFSAWFYWKSSGPHLALLLLSVVVNHALGRIIPDKNRSRWTRRLALWIGVVLNLAPLAFFKYANFALENAGLWSGRSFEPLQLVLPVGVSFFTFQGISYLVDLWLDKAAPAGDLLDFAFYQTFFPHLVAGPIVRAASFLPQISQRAIFTSADQADTADAHVLGGAERRLSVDAGLWLILKGFFKKAVLADGLAHYADLVFGNTSGYGGIEGLAGLWSYTFQIYGDFSGYTDMAIGISMLLGYRLGDNFRSPYVSLSITEFWRRWHISLSAWLRDYVYIPLGGNRKGPLAQAAFLLATMLVGGLWHGASWKFVLWGGAHGLLLVAHKTWLATRERHPFGRWMARGTRLARLLGWALTLHVVAILWVLFRADSVTDALGLVAGIFQSWDFSLLVPFLHDRALVVGLLVLALATHLWPSATKERARLLFCRLPLELKILAFVVCLQLGLEVGSRGVQPFIYFQF